MAEKPGAKNPLQKRCLHTHRFPYEEYKQAISLAYGSKGKPKAIKVIVQA